MNLRFLLPSLLVPLALVSIVACDSGPEQTGTIPEQLEALAVTLPTPGTGQSPGDALEVSGAIKITGSERTFKLAVGAEKPTEIELHSPGSSPLELLDGKSAKVAISAEGEGGRAVVVSNDGETLYAATFGDVMSVTELEKTLGVGVVKYGAEVGRQSNGVFVWVYKNAVVATDDGDVTFLPGEPKVVKIKGAQYRAVFSAVYTVETDPDADALPACSPADMLGVELLRLPAEHTATLTPLVRPIDLDVAYAGCTAPGESLE